MRRKTRHLMSYLGGIFDGEGCVTISKSKVRNMVNPSYEVHLQIQMCDEAIPRLFQNVFGGGLYCRPYNEKGRENWRPKWHWAVSSQKCVPIMRELMPYVILKAPQFEVALHLLQHRTKHRNIGGRFIQASEEMLAVQEADYIMCRNLKGRILPTVKEGN